MKPREKSPIRMVLADDHLIFLESLQSLLERESYIDIVGTATNGDDLEAVIVSAQPDLVLTDISMPGKNILTIIPAVLEQLPGLEVIVLSMYDDTHLIVDLLDAGVQGYLLKQASKAELLLAIDTVHAGGTFFAQQVTAKLLRLSAKTRYYPYKTTLEPVFSNKELEVIKLLCEELSSKEIAQQLGLSKRAVDSTRERIHKKIGTKNMAGLVRYALKNGIITLD